MAAYCVAEIDVKDAEAYKRYVAMVGPTLEGFSARFLVRGGNTDALEGDPPKTRIVIIAFDSMGEARRWYNSPAYTQAKLVRQSASIGRLYLAEG
jgi:uncharacterized protein (DUF1330 family)